MGLQQEAAPPGGPTQENLDASRPSTCDMQMIEQSVAKEEIRLSHGADPGFICEALRPSDDRDALAL